MTTKPRLSKRKAMTLARTLSEVDADIDLVYAIAVILQLEEDDRAAFIRRARQ